MTRRFLICRERRTRSGIVNEPVTLPGWGGELVMHGPSAEHVIANAREVGLYKVVAVELDVPISEQKQRNATQIN